MNTTQTDTEPTCRQCGKLTVGLDRHYCPPTDPREPCDWCGGEGSREDPDTGAPLVCGRCEGSGLDPEPTVPHCGGRIVRDQPKEGE